MAVSSITTRILRGFEDPAIDALRWSKVLASGDTDCVFLTWHWQRAWWDSFGRGKLLLILVERDNRPVVIAPLFVDSGMVFFVGSGGSDYLDFIGDIGDVEVVTAILQGAREHVTGLAGFRFYHVPDHSRTGNRLGQAADRLGLFCHDEGHLAAPWLDLRSEPESATAATCKKSLVRHERFFANRGNLEVTHLSRGEAILPHLPAFHAQHIDRWSTTQDPSLFNDPDQRAFYKRLTQVAGQAGWLRFTTVHWNGRAIAFHFGFSYRGEYMWYKPSFDIELARHSPGEVLLRQLLLNAIHEKAAVFDFGIGDEAFKRRFATHVRHMRTWGLYPRENANRQAN